MALRFIFGILSWLAHTLLNEMNGFKEVQNVSAIGACNCKDLLDVALLSPM